MDIVTDYAQMYKSQSRHDISSIKGVWQLVLLQKSKPKLSPVRIIFNKHSIIQQAAVTELLIIIYIKFEMAMFSPSCKQTNPLVGLSSDPCSSMCSATPEEVLLVFLLGVYYKVSSVHPDFFCGSFFNKKHGVAVRDYLLHLLCTGQNKVYVNRHCERGHSYLKE